MVRSRPYISKTVENYPMRRCGFFKGQEISYNISKIWLSTTIFTARAAFYSRRFSFKFCLIFKKNSWLKGLMSNLKCTKKSKDWLNLLIQLIFEPKYSYLVTLRIYILFINPSSRTVLLNGQIHHGAF